MNEQLIGLIHTLRSDLLVLKGLVHMHMSGDQRYQAEKAITDIAGRINKIWEICLGCGDEQDREGPAADGL